VRQEVRIWLKSTTPGGLHRRDVTAALEREGELEGCALAFTGTFGPDAAPMRTDDFTAYRKAEAVAGHIFALQAFERHKYGFEVLRIDADTVIPD
jgi:hypothetical protein